jgi:hypothetical protein
MEKALIFLRRLGLLVLVTWLAAACAEPSARGRLDDFRVTAHGQDAGGDFCRDFRLTPAQARWFFGRAEVLTAKQLHDRFDHLPCRARGTARGSKGSWQWEVRAGGTARLVAPDGAVQLLGCSDCEMVLGAGTDDPPSR